MPNFIPKEPSIAIARDNVWDIRDQAIQEGPTTPTGIDFHPDKQAEAVLKATGGKYTFIGSGNTDIVVSDPENPDKVIAISFSETNPLNARELFWGHRIAHILFPHNFPRFHATKGGQPNIQGQQLTGTIRQRINASDQPTQYPIQHAIDIFEQLGLKLGLDRSPRNFEVASDGGEYYLDKLIIRDADEWDTERITNYMRENNYSDRDNHQVQVAIDRLREIEKIRSQAVF